MDYLYFLVKRWKWIVLNGFIVGVLSAAVSFLLPKWYRAESVIAPPQEDFSLMGGMAQMLSAIPMTRALGLGGMSEETGLYVAILESRTVMEAVARKHDLENIYREKNLEEAVRTFRKNVDIALEDEGSVKVRVLDKNPQRAADMVNDMVFYLDSLNIRLNVQRARNNRIFIEKRLEENIREMDAAEKTLMAFQQEHNMIALEEQTEAAITVAAELQAQMLKAQFELGMISSSLGEAHSEVLRRKEQIASIENELEKLRYGKLSEEGMAIKKEKGGEVLIPLVQIPEIGQKYLTLYKQVQVQNKLYIFLVQEYEQAKIQEIKDTPTVQVIDRGVPPIRKFKPKRILIVLSCAFVCTLVLVLWICFRERLAFLQSEDPERYRKTIRILESFRRSRQP